MSRSMSKPLKSLSANSELVSLGRSMFGRRRIAAVLWIAFIAVSGNARAQDAEPPTRRILLIGQSLDGVHPAGTHEYAATMKVLAACLREQKNVEVTIEVADGEWENGPARIRQSDCVVLYVAEGARWIHATPQRLEAFAAHAAKGGGLVVVHWGMGTRPAQYIDGFLKLFGGCHGGPDRKYKVLDAKLQVASPDHPITRGVKSWEANVELYYRLKFVDPPAGLRSILKSPIEERDETVAWAWERPDGGRSFGFSGGHFHRNWKLAVQRRLLTQAILWAAKLDTQIPAEGATVDVPEDTLKLP